MPTHHQSDLVSALRACGADLEVRYYQRVDAQRLRLGWDSYEKLGNGEQYVPESIDSLETVLDWRERIHVVPGYRTRFCRSLAMTLSHHSSQWVHLSEPSHAGWRWYAGYPLKRWYAQMVNRHALGAFAYGSVASRDFLKWGIRQERIAQTFYTVNACDRNAAPDEKCVEFKADRRAFLFLGGLSPRKGTDILLRAFARASARDKNCVLLLVGNDNSNGEYSRLAKELRIDDRVLFRGAVPVGQLSNILAAGDIMMLPSRFDGWGVPLNEGASVGLPLIGSNQVGSAHHIIDPGMNGFMVQAGSVDSLSAAMSTYLTDPLLIQKHGARSLSIFENFKPEVCAERFLSTLNTWQAMRGQNRIQRWKHAA